MTFLPTTVKIRASDSLAFYQIMDLPENLYPFIKILITDVGEITYFNE